MVQTLQALTVKDAIERRHSIRRYTDDPIPREDLNEILRLASLAPSAWNVQPWRFVAVTDQNVKNRLMEAGYGQPQIGAAQVVVAVVSDMEDVLAHLAEILPPGMPAERKEQEVHTLRNVFDPQSVEQRGQWGLTQTNIAFGFLILAAQSMGYATCPMLGFDQAKVREILGLPAHALFAGLVSMGRPAEEGYPHHRHSVERITTYH